MKITVTDDAAKKLQRYTDDSNAVLLLDGDLKKVYSNTYHVLLH